MRVRFSSQLAGVGVVHIALAALVYNDALSKVIDEGIVNAVPDRAADPDTAFWYLFAGFLLTVLGWIVLRMERARAPLTALGSVLVAAGALGQFLKPNSPFWIYALIGVVALVRSRRPESGRRVTGWLLLALAAVHTIAVMSFYGDGLDAIIDGGVFNAVETSGAVPDAAFWYLFSGLTVLTLALAVRWCEHADERSLLPVAWSLVALAVWGLVVMPTSGFWLVLAVGVAGVRTGRRSRAKSQPPHVDAAVWRGSVTRLESSK